MISTSLITWLQKLGGLSGKIAWGVFLFCLPVTSFPFFPPVLGGGALVRPLSIYPLFVLMILFTLPYFWRRSIPKTVLSLAPFILVALASALFSTLRNIDPFMGVAVSERLLRALFTLGIGIAIYLTVSLYPQSWKGMRFSLRWLYTGFGVALFWGLLQTVYVVRYIHPYFQLLSRIQNYISTRRLFTSRISGMTYEPNWFAEQISFLMLPWLIASVLNGYSVFRWRWRGISIEWLLLVWCVPVMVFTYSRAGLVNLIVISMVALLLFKKQVPQQRLLSNKWFSKWVAAGLFLVLISAFLYLAGSKNNYFARIWTYWNTTKETSVPAYLQYLGIGARLVYGEAAFRTYESYPILGVGLGNYGFYFLEMLPDRPLAIMPEVLRIVTPDVGRDRIITAKVLYFRLLAETGLVGLAAFLCFVIAILGCALYLWFSHHREEKFWGTAGLLGIIVFVLAAFSFDSFAIPNMWVVFGLITAATRVSKLSSPGLSNPEISI